MTNVVRNLIHDLRYGLRQLRRAPGVTAAVLLTFMLGIGVTTAVYTIVYDTLLAPLPYPEPQQLVIVWSREDGIRNVISSGDFLDWQRQSTAFQQLAAWNESSANLSTNNQPEQLPSREVTPGYFNLQGIPFLRGRDFLADEGVPGRNHVVILTHKLWSRLGADQHILGKPLRINNQPYTVVGVLSPGLADRLGPELITPLAFSPEQINHDYHWLLVMGRLKPGVTLAQAQSNMNTITRQIAAAYPASNTGWGASVEAFQNDFLPRDRIRNLWFLLGAVGFVLLITCVNIANLLLARGAARQQEIAVRSSMGASRAAIFTQFLVESLLLASAGGVLGIALGAALLRGILHLVPEGILPSEANFHLDPAVLTVAVAVTVLAGVLFGSAPAWYASRIDPAETLKRGGRSGATSGSDNLRRLLIIGEFALALSLLAGAGLAIQSFSRLTHADLGVRPEHVLTFHLAQPQARFTTPGEISLYYDRILTALRSTPGISSATVSTGLPLRYVGDGMDFTLVGHSDPDPSKKPSTGFQSVAPDYLKTFGVDLRQGRALSSLDTATSIPVAVVNQEFVDRYLQGLDPLQQRVRIHKIIPGANQLGPEIEYQIVGVRHHILHGQLRDPYPELDVPFTQSPSPDVTIGVRTALDPSAMTSAVAAAVHSVDPTVALDHVRTLDQIKDEALGEDRFTVRLFAGFAVLALLLAAVGIHGLISFSVAQRTRELGLRLALGAARSHILLIVLREALKLALVGLSLGLVGAFAVGRLMHTTLYGVGALNPAVTAIVPTLLLAPALLAAFHPAPPPPAAAGARINKGAYRAPKS